MFKSILRFSLLLTLLPAASGATGTVPFVGCAGLSQPGSGVIGAPLGRPLTIDIPPAAAAKLALYATNGAAVLAPRGWKCLDLETTASAMLYVWPPETAGDPRAGPIVSVLRISPLASYDIDKTYFSLVFMQADTAAQPVNPVPRYKSDIVTQISPRLVSYTTPAGHSGLGNWGMTEDAQTGLPAFGVIAHSFGSAKTMGGIIWLNVRLPASVADLQPQITRYLARCLPDNNSLDCESGGALITAGSEFDGD